MYYNPTDCDLKKQNAYVYTQDKSKNEDFQKEAEAYDQLKIDGNLTDKLPVDIPIESSVMMREQYEFQPVAFLAGMIEELKEMDVQIYEQTTIKDVKEGSPVKLTTNTGYKINSGQVVIATHYPVYDPNNQYTSKFDPEISFALACEIEEDFPGGMYINADDPKRTFRAMRSNGKEYLLVGGESHHIGDGRSDEERYENILKFAEHNFTVKNVVAHWSSHDLITKDRMPMIGLIHPEQENVFVLTGFSKWGLANAAIGSKVLGGLLNNQETPYSKLFDPSRDIPDVKAENKKEATSKYKSSIHRRKVDTLKKGEALILDEDDKKIGVYKDENNELLFLDMACTHLGCGVQWNDGDKTWDCPCHGSRFEATGEVKAGPATQPLKKASR